jgi:hypothetical protein
MKFNNPILKRVVNVYQTNYVNKLPQGFGDYLRGCYCLYQICNALGLEFAMDLDGHPMSKFLDYYKENRVTDTSNNVVDKDKDKDTGKMTMKNQKPSWFYLLTTEKREQIEWIPNTNYIPISQHEYSQDPEFVNQVIKLFNQQKEETFFVYCNSIPVFQDSTRNSIKLVRSYIKPSSEVMGYCFQVMKKMRLIPKYFGVIHIRTGDHMNYKGNTISYPYMNKILSNLSPFLENKYDRMRNQGMPTKQTFLIISDNNSVKPYFSQYTNCVYYIKGVTHLGISDNGDGAANDTTDESDKKLLDTLLDFYIMQHSNCIVALTPYQWGSGFSEMAAITFCIRYKKIII